MKYHLTERKWGSFIFCSLFLHIYREVVRTRFFLNVIEDIKFSVLYSNFLGSEIERKI